MDNRGMPDKTYEYKSIYFDDPIVSQRALDIFLPETVEQDISLFFVHGGGWVAGSRTAYHKIMRAFNQHGHICASTDYRLMDEGVNIFTQIEDVRHGYLLFMQYLKDNNRSQKVFTHGTSAGAHLAALLSFADPGDCGENTSDLPDMDWIKPVGTALQSTPMRFDPWEDIFPISWAAMRKIAGVPYEKNQELYKKIAPSTYISPRNCPSFFMEAENEEMFPSEFVIESVNKMKSLGVRAEYRIYTKAEHGFFYDVTRRQQKEAFSDILEFIKSLS
jgi:acetyl esterase/lipase